MAYETVLLNLSGIFQFEISERSLLTQFFFSSRPVIS